MTVCDEESSERSSKFAQRERRSTTHRLLSRTMTCPLRKLVAFFASAVIIGAAGAQGQDEIPVQNVIIAIAMEAEALPFVNHLELEKANDFFPSNTPFEAFSGSHGNCKVTVVTNGKDQVHETGVDNVGTVPAALATFLALQKLPETDVLINAGTCGGFRRKGAEIGDVFVTTAVAHHDRRIPIPQFTEYGIGRLDHSRHDNHPLLPEEVAWQLNYKLGVCTTGNSLDKTLEDEQHMLANDAAVKDMEAAAIAWACALHDTPFMGLKVVTDIVDGEVPTQEEFLENLHAASQSLQASLPKVLDFVCHTEESKKDEL